MHQKFLWWAAGLALAVVSISLVSRDLSGTEPSALASNSKPVPAPVTPREASASFGSLPPHFEPGRREGEYIARRAGIALSLDAQGAQVRLARGDTAASLGLSLEGAAARAVLPEQRLPGVSNYFLGADPKAWRTGVPHYARVRYDDVYPGIDLVYYGRERTLEYDFEVAPGADPGHIRMTYRGARELRIEPNGDLRVELAGGALLHRAPVSYQVKADGSRHEVASRFELRDGVVTFALGDWDRALPLVIDPVLEFATFFGGSNNNELIQQIHVDFTGAIYIAGHSGSPDLPVSAGAYQPANAGQFDLFVAKLNSTGTTLLYSTYIGGSSIEQMHLLRVDFNGNAYLVGETTSTDFPVTVGAAQTTFGGVSDLVVSKLDPDGSALVYSTYLGGSGSEPASSMIGGFAVDDAGNAYVYSDTNSVDYPVSPGAPQETRGNPNGGQSDQDVVLTRINPAGTAFSFSTYHGGTGFERVGDLAEEGRLFALDSNGFAWIAGTTESPDMPVTANAFDGTYNGGVGDFFIARYDTAGAGFQLMSTFIGGTGDDLAESFVLGGDDDAFIAGRVSNGFPVTVGAADTTYNGGSSDIGIAKIGADISQLAFATYLGGDDGESVRGLRVLPSNSAVYIGGSTQSTNFPATAGAADTTFNGGQNDGFIARLNPQGTAFDYVTLAGSSDTDGVFFFHVDADGSAYGLLGDVEGDAFVSAGGFAHEGEQDDYFVKVDPTGSTFLDASYLGGGENDTAVAMFVDAFQNLYLAGMTESADFPTTPGTIQPTKPSAGGNADGFLVKFATTPPGGPVAQPGTLALGAATFTVAEGVGNAAITVSRSGGTTGAVSVTCSTAVAGTDTATSGADFTATSVTLNWADGDATAKTCSVPIANDDADEGDETFSVSLSNAQGGATIGAPAAAVVTITDDDDAPAPQPGTVQFNPATYSVNENGGSVTLTLTRTLGADGAISVSIASGGGSASAGSDYTAVTQTVSWADGDAAAKTVVLTVLDDTVDEPNETVTLSLSNATGGATLGTATATVTIVDDDLPPPATDPGSQPGSVNGKYGKGGIDGWLLIGLALAGVMVVAGRIRHRAVPARALPLVAVAIAVASPQTRAEDGWYVGLRAGVVESTREASSVQRALQAAGHDVQVELEDRDPAFTLLGGYRWQNGLAIELGLSHLGEYDVVVQGTTEDPDALLADTLASLADAGRAVSASVAWNLTLGERWELTPRVGAYYWKSRRVVVSGSQVMRREDDGVDLTAGLMLSLKFANGWSLGLGYEGWAAQEANDLRVWQVGVTRRFD